MKKKKQKEKMQSSRWRTSEVVLEKRLAVLPAERISSTSWLA